MSRRRSVLLLGLALASCLLAGCGSSLRPPVRPPGAAPLSSIFQADRQLQADPGGTLDRLASWGVDTVRVLMPWGHLNGYQDVAPDPGSPSPPPGFDARDPAAYPAAGWAVYDAIVRAAAARRIRVDLTLSPPPPLWAQGAGDPGHPVHPQWRPSARAFGEFVTAVGRRYSGAYRPPGAAQPLPRVGMWGIWNEPNFGPMLAPQAVDGSRLEVSPALYRSLLDAAWPALRRTGHGQDTILIGELAPRGIALGNSPGSFGYMVPLRFLRALYCVDDALRPLQGPAAAARACPAGGRSATGFAALHPALFDAPGFAVHPYPVGPPDLLTQGEPDFADLPALAHVEHLLDRLTSLYGHPRRFPLYSTEFGYLTNPPEHAIGTVTPALAAVYLNQSEYLSWLDPRLRSYDQYLLEDVPSGQFASGLEFPGGAPKPTLAAYRMPIWLPRAPQGRLTVWGAVRAAGSARRATGLPQRVRLLFWPAAGGGPRVLLTRVVSGSHGYFQVQLGDPGPGRLRSAWTPPGGATIYSRSVTLGARG